MNLFTSLVEQRSNDEFLEGEPAIVNCHADVLTRTEEDNMVETAVCNIVPPQLALD